MLRDQQARVLAGDDDAGVEGVENPSLESLGLHYLSGKQPPSAATDGKRVFLGSLCRTHMVELRDPTGGPPAGKKGRHPKMADDDQVELRFELGDEPSDSSSPRSGNHHLARSSSANC